MINCSGMTDSPLRPQAQLLVVTRAARCQPTSKHAGDDSSAVREEKHELNCTHSAEQNAQADIEQSGPHANGRAVSDPVVRKRSCGPPSKQKSRQKAADGTDPIPAHGAKSWGDNESDRRMTL